MEIVYDICKILLLIGIVLSIHELGHLLAGLVQGWKFQLFVIGFIGLGRYENGKIRLYLNRNMGHFGGVSATSPTGAGDEHLNQFARVVLAGPMASLALSLIAAAVALFANLPQAFWWGLAAASMGVFLATTLPCKSGMFFSDRKRYQRIRDKGNTAEVEMALLRVVVSQTTQVINAVDEKDFELIKTDKDPVIQFMGSYLGLSYYLETGSDKAEKEEVEYLELMKAIPASQQKLFTKEIEALKSK